MPDPVEAPTNPSPPPPPPRAFSQGVGLLIQVVGGTLFLISFFTCCGSSLISKDVATHSDLTRIGWHFAGDRPGEPTYSAQKALTISMFGAVFFGLALAGMGLGLQAESPRAPIMGIALTVIATVFWCTQTVFAWSVHASIFFT